MPVYNSILSSLREILADSPSTVVESSCAKAEWQWHMSVAATEQLLLNSLLTASPDAKQGLVLASPVPVFSDSRLTQSLRTVTFTSQPFNPLALMPSISCEDEITPHNSVMPLLSADPLVREQFCLVFTDKFSLALVLAEDNDGEKTFSFSFEPEILQQVWQALGSRVILSNPDLFIQIDELVQKYFLAPPDYRIVMQFSQLLLAQLPEPVMDKETSTQRYPRSEQPSPKVPANHPSSSLRHDVELLLAFAHEVRTPLTTIRTRTRLLLKKCKDLPANVIKHLEVIDHECTEQIDRMELLFKAAELETCSSMKSTSAQLTAMSLDQVLQESIPRWQQAANRRNLTLNVVLPQHVPTVVSNPTMLDSVLTGLIENFTRSLPPGSHIEVKIIPAGDQLKFQLLPQPQPQTQNNSITTALSCQPPIRKAIGQLLTFQPETGTISLNLAATKHLFQAIGGKLIVRERPQHGEVLTIFLPLKE